MSADPGFSAKQEGDALEIALEGGWVVGASRALEDAAAALQEAGGRAKSVRFDFSGLERLDTAGAWMIDKARVTLNARGIDAQFVRMDQNQATLLGEAKYVKEDAPAPRRVATVFALLADLGEAMVGAGRDLVTGVAFLGEVVTAFLKLLLQPVNFRPISLVFHMEAFGFRSVPIIATINFLVGCIVAQQGLFQLRRFGAATYAVDLVGILVLRELGVLLTSIMIAGRSGSAITAEIGSMKMREEIDALRVMGLSSVEVLIVPRILALIFSLPLLTFLADMSALFGGLVVSWSYGGINPAIFMARLQGAIGLNTFLVGLIKAPFMALAIGLIAAVEGFAVEGSAESLGRRVTASVVKAIFMVIVVDGLFAIFFASIRY